MLFFQGEENDKDPVKSFDINTACYDVIRHGTEAMEVAVIDK